MTNSKDTAALIVASIQAADGIRTKQICHDLGITIDQFQAAKPYIRVECECIKLNWRVKA